MKGADRRPLPLPRQAAALPSHPAVIWPGGELSYAELSALADRLARGLAGAGVGSGDRLALLLPGDPLVVALVHAAARLGAIVVPLNTRLAAPEIAWQLAHTRPKALVYDPALAGALVGAPDEPLRIAALPERGGGVGGIDVPEPTGEVELAPDVDLEAPQAIVYTSGTTGRPKGAVLTHGNLLWSAVGSALRLGVVPGDRWLAPLPLFHVGGLAILLRGALAGTTVVLPASGGAEDVAEALRGGDVTLLSVVPTMLARLLGAWGDAPAPAGLRAVLVGGGPAPRDLLDRAAAQGFPVAPTYGLTEAASQVTTAPPGSPVTGSAGPPLAFTEVRVVDAEGRDVPRGTAGEILVRGPTVMAGYWNDPEATARALAGGWLHTGDIGRLDEAGALFALERREELIVTGGENVYPAEVEAVLDAHPAVEASCVVGVPDPDWGERVVAVVVRSSGAEVTAEELDRHTRERLAGYKVPRRIVWAADLPRTPAGKVRRAEVRAWPSLSEGV